MKKVLTMMEEELKQAFADSGYEDRFAKVVLSNRPDLCEYQCNGAMAAAKVLCALARFGCHQLIQLRIFREFICERHKGTGHLDKPVSGFHIRNIRHLKVGDI